MQTEGLSTGSTTATRGRAVELSRLSARPQDLDDAAMVAARAFHHDPFFEFLDRCGITRARGLAVFWRSAIAAASSAATMTGARGPDGRLLGVSVVLEPGAYPLPAMSQARELFGATRAMIRRPRALARGSRYLLAIDRAHIKERHLYLMLLVVDPSAQRSGIGALLQAEMLERADSDGLDCYLETQKPENVPYYRRFGYELEQELRPVSSGPPLFTMRRRPIAPGDRG